MSDFIVAIDGPAGSGKSSVSKQVARQLSFGYLDTGAAYRALAWATLHHKNLELIRLPSIELNREFDYSISLDPNTYWVSVGDTDVTTAIRGVDVVERVSQVAKIPSVRSFMKQLTRELAANCEQTGLVIEGRDITTVVFPDADVRILLTASEQTRIQRRAAELTDVKLEDLAKSVTTRDQSDLQVVDFQSPATGVALIDTTELDFAASVDAVVQLISSAADRR